MKIKLFAIAFLSTAVFAQPNFYSLNITIHQTHKPKIQKLEICGDQKTLDFILDTFFSKTKIDKKYKKTLNFILDTFFSKLKTDKKYKKTDNCNNSKTTLEYKKGKWYLFSSPKYH